MPSKKNSSSQRSSEPEYKSQDKPTGFDPVDSCVAVVGTGFDPEDCGFVDYPHQPLIFSRTAALRDRYKLFTIEEQPEEEAKAIEEEEASSKNQS